MDSHVKYSSQLLEGPRRGIIPRAALAGHCRGWYHWAIFLPPSGHIRAYIVCILKNHVYLWLCNALSNLSLLVEILHRLQCSPSSEWLLRSLNNPFCIMGRHTLELSPSQSKRSVGPETLMYPTKNLKHRMSEWTSVYFLIYTIYILPHPKSFLKKQG